jgi:hypothetical protein
MFSLRLMGLMVLIGIIGVGCSAAETEENMTGVEIGWAGTWIDNTGTLVLTEDGLNVTGVYTEPQTAVSETIEGTISEDGKVLSGSWSLTGPFTYAISDDGTYFNGTFGYGEINTVDEVNNTWNGTLTSEAVAENPWSGSWNSAIGAVTTLIQDGKAVNGTYEKIDPEDFSVIEGNVSEDGETLSGTWTEIGLFTLTMSDDGMNFNGTYGFGSKDTIKGSDENWNGVRAV